MHLFAFCTSAYCFDKIMDSVKEGWGWLGLMEHKNSFSTQTSFHTSHNTHVRLNFNIMAFFIFLGCVGEWGPGMCNIRISKYHVIFRYTSIHSWY